MRFRWFFLFAAALWLTACDQTDTKREALETADRRIKVGAYREAIKAYENALDGSDATADVHYKIAVLYDDKLKEPLAAVHHYDRYLAFAAAGRYAKEAKSARADCEKRLQAKMTKEGFMTTSEAVRLRHDNERLNRIITELRNPKPPVPAPRPDPAKPDGLPPGSKHHTVTSGETLGSIALKYYRSKTMSNHIKDANFNQLGGKDIIRPGQVLIIPEAPKRRR